MSSVTEIQNRIVSSGVVNLLEALRVLLAFIVHILHSAAFSSAVAQVRTALRSCIVASGHTASNTPDPIRTRKLSCARPGQYWGGGPPGKPFGCCWLFIVGTSSKFIDLKLPVISEKVEPVELGLQSLTYLAGVGPRSRRWLSIG